MIEIKRGVYYPKKNEQPDTREIIKELKRMMEIQELKIARYCYHENEDSSLMAMIIVVKDKYEYPIHRHGWKDESYIILEGECTYEEYSKDGKKEAEEQLKSGDFYYNGNRGFHCLRPTTNLLCYIEHTVGPFKAQKLDYI